MEINEKNLDESIKLSQNYLLETLSFLQILLILFR
jgi:hypothetical protein